MRTYPMRDLRALLQSAGTDFLITAGALSEMADYWGRPVKPVDDVLSRFDDVQAVLNDLQSVLSAAREDLAAAPQIAPCPAPVKSAGAMGVAVAPALSPAPDAQKRSAA